MTSPIDSLMLTDVVNMCFILLNEFGMRDDKINFKIDFGMELKLEPESMITRSDNALFIVTMIRWVDGNLDGGVSDCECWDGWIMWLWKYISLISFI